MKFKKLKPSFIGKIDNNILCYPVAINHPEFGKSTQYPASLKIKIDPEANFLGGIGKKVHSTFFKNEPPLTFNVSFSCHKPSFFKKSFFADPFSIWFNVFFGYYEIDVSVKKWKRPFGYNLSNGARSINYKDILKIGKADWNYFSNFLYGVPEEYIKPHNTLEDEGLIFKNKKINLFGNFWDQVEVENFKVVSAYQATNDRTKLRSNSKSLTPLWQLAFGRSKKQTKIKESFFPTKMKASFYLFYKKEYDKNYEEEVFKTFFFGGTINLDYPSLAKINNRSLSEEKLIHKNNKFLEEQLKAVQKIIGAKYSNLGFKVF